MRVKVQKWGNSLAVRIPKSFAIETKIKQDSTVDIAIFDGNILLKPQAEKTDLSLNEMLEKITKENLHSEIDVGEPIGKEIF